MYEGLNKVTLEYVQENDSEKIGLEPNVLKLETVDDYFIMQTNRWAFTSIEDLMVEIQDIVNLGKECIK